MKRLIEYLVLAALAGMPTMGWAETDAIANKAIQARQVTREEARAIYLLKERSCANEGRVIVFRLPLRDKIHREFVRDVLKMTDREFDAQWALLVNAGIAPLIGEVKTQSEMVRTISRKPNAVGYLNHDYLLMNIGGSDVAAIRIVD